MLSPFYFCRTARFNLGNFEVEPLILMNRDKIKIIIIYEPDAKWIEYKIRRKL